MPDSLQIGGEYTGNAITAEGLHHSKNVLAGFDFVPHRPHPCRRNDCMLAQIAQRAKLLGGLLVQRRWESRSGPAMAAVAKDKHTVLVRDKWLVNYWIAGVGSFEG